MKFERLPNELLLDIFDYLDGIALLRAFGGLNTRINDLLHRSIKSYHFDFRTISKSDFESIFHPHRQFIGDQIQSIRIADDDETPNLPTLFFSQHFDYIHLRSLSLYSIYCSDTLNDIALQCHHRLPCLTDLKFIQCVLNNASDSTMNTIWQLPKLRNCVIDEVMSKAKCFAQLDQTSSSIEYLSIRDVHCDIRCLSKILQHTPRLERLAITIISATQNEPFSIALPLLTQLNLSFRGSLPTLTRLFEQMSNLRSLTYRSSDSSLNGHEWEDIFLHYLPHVKQFRAEMRFYFSLNDDLEENIDELLLTYRTDFWIKQHQWFVRCDCNPTNPFNLVTLYTLPYPFEDFRLPKEYYSRSTSDEEDFWSYEHVRKLQCKQDIPEECSIEFSNLSHLEIIFPLNDSLFRNISSLNYLTSLDVTLLLDDSVYDQLQMVLDHAPQLYLLRFSHLLELEMRLFELKNPSIRRLDFFTKESILYSWYFNREYSLALANSSLGQQCQTLVIDVEHRTHILDLINRMTKLQSLTFQCKDDKWNSKSSTDELLQWFYEHLPSTCSISRHTDQTSIIRLWIR